jgi:heat shock protein HslJ
MLKLGPFAGTRMACAPAVLAVEERFLAALGDVTSLVFTTSGEAVLATADGRRLRLRRPPAR